MKDIKDLLEPIAQELDIKILKVISSSSAIQIILEKKDSSLVTVGECGSFSSKAKIILNANNIDYGILEVGSPGINREFYSLDDYNKFINQKVSVDLKLAIDYKDENLKHIKGILLGLDNNIVKIGLNDEVIELDFNNIKKTKLYIKEELFNTKLGKKRKNERKK